MDTRWYVHVEGENYGPYSARDIQRLVEESRIIETNYVRVEGGTAWVEARNDPILGVLVQSRAQAEATYSSIKIYSPRSGLQLISGIILIVLGLFGLLLLKDFWNWFWGGPLPQLPRAFIGAGCFLFLPLGVLCLLNALRGLPRLTVTPQGVRLDTFIRPRSANWNDLDPFAIKTVGRLFNPVQIASAKFTVDNANKGRGRRRPRTFTVSDQFRAPLDAIVAELNVARSNALGLSDSFDWATVAKEVDIGLAGFKLPWLTFALLLVLIVVFMLENEFVVTPGRNLTPSIGTLVAMGGLSRTAVLSGGEWYRLFTAPLLHLNLTHIVSNGVGLLLGGWPLERLVGRLWFFSFFVAGVIGGSLLSLVLGAPQTISVGASGALMGLFAALLVSSFRLPAGSSTRQKLQMNSTRVLIPSLLPLFSSANGIHVDYAAHFGGAIGGAIVAAPLLTHWPQTARIPRLRKVAAAIVIIGVTLFVASVTAVIGNYQRYDVETIPQFEIPKTSEGRHARAAYLAARYPADPRSHFFLFDALIAAKDNAGAERELRLALANAQRRPALFSPELELAILGTLASLLLDEGKRDEAKEFARPLCSSPAGDKRIDTLVKLLNREHLCE